MRINRESYVGQFVTVYLDGKKVDDAVEASEEDGYIWAMYRNANGHLVPEIDAEKGALVYEGAQVIKLTGNVRVEIDVCSFTPITPTLVQ